jgi:hypothetical protein
VIRVDSTPHGLDKLAILKPTKTQQELRQEAEATRLRADLQIAESIRNRDLRYFNRSNTQAATTFESSDNSTVPTLAVNTPLPESPKTPERIDLPRPRRTNNMTSTADDKLFRGDYSAGEKPHIWFRRLEAKFDEDTPLKTKLYRFSKNLEPGRPAESWYSSLTPIQKLDWDDFYGEFTARWPLPITIQPSREELLDRLNQTILDDKEVGKTIERDGDKIYTHVVWAEEVRTLIDALDDAKGHLIPQAKRNLPPVVRLILGTELNTWDKFLTAVVSLSMERLADQRESMMVIHNNILETMNTGGQQQYNMNTVTTKLAATNFYTPIHPAPAYTARASTIQSTPKAAPPVTPNTVRQAYAPAQQWSPRTPSTPTNQRFNQPLNTPSGSFLSANATLHPSSIFANQRTPTSPSPTPQELARKAIAASSTFLNNPEGHVNYQTALQA